MRMRLLTYPATLMIAIAGVYVAVRVAPGHRLQTFAMLAMTSVGITELVMAATRVGRGTTFGYLGVANVVTGLGALVVGYSLLGKVSAIPFGIGALLYAAGAIIWQRAFTTGA